MVERYDEPHELRSARGKPDAHERRDQAPALTDAQRAAFGRVEVAVAIDLPFDVAAVAPGLRWVQAVGAGTAQLQSAGLAEAGIRLSSAAGANAVGIAEFALARVLAHWKGFRQLDADQAAHVWEPRFGRQLAGCTLGLLGLGAINSAVAARAQAFGMRVVATRRSATPGATAPDVDELFPTTELHAMLADCDVVVAAVPETPETRGLIDADAIAAMRPGAFFVNVGRGSLVDEPALIAALENGHLGGAALDVASVEPLPPEHPCGTRPTSSSLPTRPRRRRPCSPTSTSSSSRTSPPTWRGRPCGTRSTSAGGTEPPHSTSPAFAQVRRTVRTCPSVHNGQLVHCPRS